MTETKQQYKTIEIRLPLTDANVAYAMIEGVENYASLARGAVNTLEARIAVLELQNAELRAKINELMGDPK